MRFGRFFNGGVQDSRGNIAGISISGGNIDMVGGRIIVDGVDVTDQHSIPENILRIEIVGKVENIKTDKSVNVQGDVLGSVDAGGAVNCGNIQGNVNARGSVNCDDVGGSVDAGGSVNADDIGGDVKSGGSVRADVIHGRTNK